MMPNLGKYAEAVLSSYAISITLIIGLIVFSVMRAKRVNRQLQEIENKVKSNG